MNELCDICKQREGHKYLEKDYIEMFTKSKKRIWIWVCRKCHAFLNDGIVYLHVPSALKHLKESHDITERTLELHVIKDFIKES